MKILVDKMPEHPAECSFAELVERNSIRWFICKLSYPFDCNPDKCQRLKEAKDD